MALGGTAPEASRRKVNADEDVGRPFASVAPGGIAGAASINLFNLASPACGPSAPFFVFFPARRAAAAFACFAASAGGSSLTSWYSKRTRADMFARSAASFVESGVSLSNV